MSFDPRHPSGTLPRKPNPGSPCNGCGICCQLELCFYGIDVFGEQPGPCPALEYENGRAWCGLLRHPFAYTTVDGINPNDLTIAQRNLLAGTIQTQLASDLGVGMGCDSEGTHEDYFPRT